MSGTESNSYKEKPLKLFEGGGEMGALMEAYDWEAHPLGRPEQWPASLQTMIRLMLRSAYPMFIWWSEELYMFHNDPYLPALGKKHPRALGASARDIWAEIWDEIGGVAENILQGSTPFYAEEMLLFLERKGFPEETYWTFSYSPAPDNAGGVGGVFCACNEVTNTVLGRRRMKTIKDIADATAEIVTVEEACRKAGHILEQNNADIPFSLIYLFNRDGTAASLAVQTGGVDEKYAPNIINLNDSSAKEIWPLQEVLQQRKSKTLDLAVEQQLLSGGPGQENSANCVIIPIFKPGEDNMLGFFISGISPMLEYNADYRSFQQLLVGQIATSIAVVRAREEAERQQEDLVKLFEQAPVAIAILRGPDLIVELANPGICEIWGRQHYEVIHKPVFEVLKEARGQGLEEILQEVMDTGEPYVASERPVPLNRNGIPKMIFINFVYYPLRNAQHIITGVTAVAVEVTEQVESRQQIEAKNNELLAINADLDNFVYSASHDLKAPISNIEGLMHALLRYLPEQTLASAKVSRLISLIEASIDRFKKTVIDLTEVTKIQRDAGEDVEEVNMAGMIEEVRLDLESMIAEAQARIETDFITCQTVRFSAKNLRSIVYNLLSNALKYRSPDRPLHIIISSHTHEKYCVFSVSDNGLGMRSDDRSKIFSMFKRLHDHVEGSGIGLYIVKKIVENAGGKIEVESEPDRGTTFRVYFKKA